MAALGYSAPGSVWPERVIVVCIVALLHLVLFAVWLMQPRPPQIAVREISISFANLQRPQTEVESQPVIKPESNPAPRARANKPEAPVAAKPQVREESIPAAPAIETPTSPIQLDAEPDYRADYLNNPRPPYPMMARRMGYQGKVILNVEVLADGKVGEVRLEQGCGYRILDEAALQTVKTWRFSPARRLGRPVTRWFLVPIKFSLKD